jgi:hypothetical protein
VGRVLSGRSDRDIGSRRVVTAVIAVDPFDAAEEDYWRQHFGFPSSLTKRPNAKPNLCLTNRPS